MKAREVAGLAPPTHHLDDSRYVQGLKQRSQGRYSPQLYFYSTYTDFHYYNYHARQNYLLLEHSAIFPTTHSAI